MVSTYTTNKHIEKPGHNDYVDTWDSPVNSDLDVIDKALGGTTYLNVTGASGTTTLTISQYQAAFLNISGTLTANVVYSIPANVGGQWTVSNSATGPYNVTLASAGNGSTVTLTTGNQILFSDGTSVNTSTNLSNGSFILGNTTVFVGNTTTTVGNLALNGASLNTATISNSTLINASISSLAAALPALLGGTGITAPGASGNVLTSTGSAWTSQSFTGITALSTQTFTANGTYTPTTGMKYCIVFATGGGGGGGGTGGGGPAGAGGGQAGGTAIKVFSAATIGASQAITIGSGGSGGNNSGGSGSSGGTTTFGSLLSCSGGSGSSFNNSGNPGVGGSGSGTATNGAINLTGGDGNFAYQGGGTGGSSFWGGGGRGGGYDENGVNASSYGSGGGGGGAAGYGSNGGNGKSGVVFVIEFL